MNMSGNDNKTNIKDNKTSIFEKYYDTLLRVELFSTIDRKQISLLLDCLKPKICSFDRNDCIISAGDAIESIGLMLKGKAIVSKENAAGARVIVNILNKGDIFGEAVAFSRQTRWPVTVQAQERCEVFFLPRMRLIGECSKICPWHRTLIYNFLKIISERTIMLSKKVEYLSIKSIRGKISTYLLEQYNNTGNKNMILPLNRNELADFLNVSRPSMSREMCKMRDEGIIDFHLRAFRILDLEALKQMSIS